MSKKHHLQANSIRANDGEKILIRDGVQSYEVEYHQSDFDDDDLINKRAVAEMIGNGIALPEAVSFPTGTIINSDGFVVLDYSSFIAHGDLPGKEWQRIETGYVTTFYPEMRQYPATGTPTEIWVYAGDINDGSNLTNWPYQLVLR